MDEHSPGPGGLGSDNINILSRSRFSCIRVDSWNELVIPDSFSGKGFAQNPAVVLKGCPYWTAGARIWK
ncbi:hypothetical protein DCAR_0100581 [Daucus carota subsp. sativus]|uniref:Uncharacterized protein n=1 Tax=Daucus carota subsp. sativus TaxID=79200 RepID=A0A166FS09_DAUCS|nr:hypothetical protein DCAR_0100581 [Daucus carota subsp. sativus]